MRFPYHKACAQLELALPSVFSTTRLVASRLTWQDTADIHTALAESTAELSVTCDWAVGSGSEKFSRRFVAGLLAENKRGQRADYVVREIAGRLAVGMVALCRNRDRAGDWEIGFWRRSGCRGSNFMAEVARPLISVVQPQLHAAKLLLTCDEKSTHVIRLAQNLGFAQIAIINNEMDSHGRFRQVLVFALQQGSKHLS
ncbi:MAG: GNAT family N-acetyltransferase [Phycisphaerae bacterium]|nr:GNAT family N-acetyltransferase [Phycisphaerae bacterium]